MSDVPEWLQNANEYAVALIRSNKLHAAETTLRRALALSPRSFELWTNLGACLWNQRRYDPALEAIRRALEIAPGYPKALANLGLIYEGLREYELSERAFDAAVEGDPDYLDARWDRSLLWLGRGDYARGWIEYDTRIDRQRHVTYPHLADIPMWNGEELGGKTIFVEAEQGVGDTILFSRFLPLLAKRAERVLFCAGQRVTSLLWYYGDCVEFIPPRVPLPSADFYSYLASLPRWLGCDSLEAVPPDPGFIRRRVERERGNVVLPEPAIKPSLKVGVCWTGNPIQDRNDERTVPFPLMLSLASHPCVALYSLQVGHGADEIRRHGAEGLVHDLNPILEQRGFVGTGEAIAQMDLVVTCCTSVAHVAGALGVPTWLLLCRDPYWPWLYSDRTDTVWYPSIRLFRQQEPGAWAPVVKIVHAELDRSIRERFSPT